MNIYLVERTDHVGWDEFDAVVVLANDEEAAQKMFPEGDWKYDASCLVVTLVGVATPQFLATRESDHILQSFHAG